MFYHRTTSDMVFRKNVAFNGHHSFKNRIINCLEEIWHEIVYIKSYATPIWKDI